MGTLEVVALWATILAAFCAVVAVLIAMAPPQNIPQTHAGAPKLSFQYGLANEEYVGLQITLTNEPITNRLLRFIGVSRQPTNISVYISTEKLDGSLSTTRSERLHEAPYFELRAGNPITITAIRWRKFPPMYVDKPFTGMHEEEYPDTEYLDEGEYCLYVTVEDSGLQKTWRESKRFIVRTDGIYWLT
jgi:hypothetical protein